MPTPKPNRWHPVMLPDDYLVKLRQDLAEHDALVEPHFLASMTGVCDLNLVPFGTGTALPRVSP